MNKEYLEAEVVVKEGIASYKIKGKVHEGITNLNGRNKIIKNGRTVKVDVKLIELAGKPVFKVIEY